MPDTALFIRPVDVLFFRGNRLFGEAGSYGESLMPPPPSVAAGALRSALMAARGIEPAAFATGAVQDPDLGQIDQPGDFTLMDWHLARHDGETVHTFHRLPADLLVKRLDDGSLSVERMQPTAIPKSVTCSAATEQLAVLPEKERGKPVTNLWLDEQGWQTVLEGKIPQTTHLVESPRLWTTDIRTGVGLHPQTRRADDGKLFATQAIAPTNNDQGQTGFVARVQVSDWPGTLLLRLGGDGRAAIAEPQAWQPPRAHLADIVAARRARLILTSPGLFPEGWQPGKDGLIQAPGLRARIVCAAVPRAETVSGYDLARRRPKPAERVAPVGSVYWLDDLEADEEALNAWLDAGLWAADAIDPMRRAEGYNRFAIARF